MSKKLIFYLLILFIKINGQEKYGYFDYAKTVESTQFKGLAKEYLSAFELNFNDSFIVLQNKLENFYKGEFPKDRKLDSLEIKRLEAILSKLEQNISDFRDKIREEYSSEEIEVEIEIRKKIAGLVFQFYKQENIKLLVDKESLLYCSEGFDYTDQLIKFIADRKQNN